MAQYNCVLALSSGMTKSHGKSQITILLSPDCHEEGETEMPVYHHMGDVHKNRWYIKLSRRQLSAIIPIFLSVYGRHGGWKFDHLKFRT
jgi:hypothetical protein